MERNFIAKFEETRKKLCKLIRTKTRYWKHPDQSWLKHSAKMFVKNAVSGYLLKLVISLLFSLMKKGFKPRELLKIFMEKDKFNFGLFTGLWCFISKISMCALRRIRDKEDSYNSLISGALCSLALLVDRKGDFKMFIALYVFARSLDSFVGTLNHNKIAKIGDNWSFWLYDVMVSWLVLMVIQEPLIAGKTNRALYKKFYLPKEIEDYVIDHLLYNRGKVCARQFIL